MFVRQNTFSANPFPSISDALQNLFLSLWDENLPHIPPNFTRFIRKAFGLLKPYFACKEEGCPLHHLVPKSTDQGLQTTPPKKVSFGSHWVPPIKSAENTNDYLHQFLGDLGYF
jgi:hypothetical protein